MRDSDCVALLQWALPRLHMRWQGFRKVRGQVCKRIQRRIGSLELTEPEAYRRYLEFNEQEWHVLDSLCRISISRFCRDIQVFTILEQKVLPSQATKISVEGGKKLKVWSIGCASGEEPYTLSLLWQLSLQQRFPGLEMDILASDADPHMIQRARAATYRYGSMKNLPRSWCDAAFFQAGEWFTLKPEYQRNVHFVVQDVRRQVPDERFDLVLCRNLVFTYYQDSLQRECLERINGVLTEDGLLVIGIHESLPAGDKNFSALYKRQGIYRKQGG